MSMSEKKTNVHGYFTTGEFAKLHGVKKQTLFHYDDIDLFSPAIIEENGYRYYSTNQIELFEVIQILRGLNMPLKGIKAYLDSRSINSITQLFHKKASDIDKKIEELNWQKAYMNDKLSIIDNAVTSVKGKPFAVDMKEEHFITTEYHGPDDDNNISIAVSKHIKYCKSIDVYSSYVIGGMIPTDSVPTPKLYDYSHFYTRLESYDSDKSTYVKPAGKYALIYHEGDYDTIYDTYISLVNFCHKNNFSMGKHFYENEVVNQLVVSNHKDYIIQIAVQIL